MFGDAEYVHSAGRERLGLPPGAGAVYLERLRRLDGRPLSLDTTYLAADIEAICWKPISPVVMCSA